MGKGTPVEHHLRLTFLQQWVTSGRASSEPDKDAEEMKESLFREEPFNSVGQEPRFMHDFTDEVGSSST